MFDLNELKDKIAVIGVGNTKYGNFPEIDDYGLAAAGIEDGAFRNGEHRLWIAGVDLRVDIHVRKQCGIGIRQFNPDTGGSRLPVQLRIDHIDVSGELAAGSCEAR